MASPISSQKEIYADTAQQMLNQFRELENQTTKQDVMSYNSIILLFANAHNFDKALELLAESEEKNVWAENGSKHARIYTSLIDNMAKNTFDVKAKELHDFGITKNIWEGYPEQYSIVKNALEARGFNMDR